MIIVCIHLSPSLLSVYLVLWSIRIGPRVERIERKWRLEGSLGLSMWSSRKSWISVGAHVHWHSAILFLYPARRRGVVWNPCLPTISIPLSPSPFPFAVSIRGSVDGISCQLELDLSNPHVIAPGTVSFPFFLYLRRFLDSPFFCPDQGFRDRANRGTFVGIISRTSRVQLMQ